LNILWHSITPCGISHMLIKCTLIKRIFEEMGFNQKFTGEHEWTCLNIYSEFPLPIKYLCMNLHSLITVNFSFVLKRSAVNISLSQIFLICLIFSLTDVLYSFLSHKYDINDLKYFVFWKTLFLKRKLFRKYTYIYSTISIDIITRLSTLNLKYI